MKESCAYPGMPLMRGRGRWPGNLVTSCSQQVEESMKIKTHSPRVVRARKTLIELLLSNHPVIACIAKGMRTANYRHWPQNFIFVSERFSVRV
jgi:hypothetical protein